MAPFNFAIAAKGFYKRTTHSTPDRSLSQIGTFQATNTGSSFVIYEELVGKLEISVSFKRLEVGTLYIICRQIALITSSSNLVSHLIITFIHHLGFQGTTTIHYINLTYDFSKIKKHY